MLHYQFHILYWSACRVANLVAVRSWKVHFGLPQFDISDFGRNFLACNYVDLYVYLQTWIWGAGRIGLVMAGYCIID